MFFLRKLLPPQVHTVKIPKQEPGPSMSPQAWQQYFAARLHRGNTDNAALNEAQKYVRLHVPHHNYGGVTSEYVDDLLSLLPHSLQGTGLQVRTQWLSVNPSMMWDVVQDSQSSRCLGILVAKPLCPCCAACAHTTQLSILCVLLHASCVFFALPAVSESGRGAYMHLQRLEFGFAPLSRG